MKPPISDLFSAPIVTGDCSFEGIEAQRPEALIKRQPTIGLGERAGLELAAVRATLNGAAEQPRPFQHLHVLGRRRKGHVEGLGQFAHGAHAARELPQHRASGGIAQRGKHAIERQGLLFNHLV